MNPLLLELAIRGTIVATLVLILDRGLDRCQRPEWRRFWWFIVSIAWILPFHLPHRRAIPSLPLTLPANWTTGLIGAAPRENWSGLSFHARFDWAHLAAEVWLVGAALNFGVIALRTAWTARRWSGVRLCTDHEMLELFEDCKKITGVRAPIALALTPRVSSPALLGWLRPRILFPETLAHTLSREELRGVFFHELAHVRAGDIPMQWLFCLGRSLHWFNPIAHLATRRWMYFRELAADAAALAWMPETSRDAYGHALIAAVREANPLPLPQGALALGESFNQLKLRITMIAHSQNRARLVWLASLVSVALFAVALLPRTLAADDTATEAAAKSVAKANGDAWLNLMDTGKFAESWSEAAAGFKKMLTSDQWVARAGNTRGHLGNFISRHFESALYQKNPTHNNKTTIGEFVIEQFDSSFENLKHARETVALTKDPDGQWRVTGYFVKPN
jgi:beta-lactamase regulating signal transducer with metallopeptidase domain